MATSKVLEIELLNANGGTDATFKLDNPNSDVTKAQVVTAFNDFLEANYLIGNSGAALTSVGTVTLVTTDKVVLETAP